MSLAFTLVIVNLDTLRLMGSPVKVEEKLLQNETSVRKGTILMSLGLMTKLHEDNLCDAAVDRVDDRPGLGG